MTASNCLYLLAVSLAVMGWGTSGYADDDVTVIATAAATAPPTQKTPTSDGTPVVHKSLHRKKVLATAVASAAAGSPTSASPTPAATSTDKSGASNSMGPEHPEPGAPATVAAPGTNALTPAVETGLPVARYPGMGSPIKGVSTYLPSVLPVPTMKSPPATPTHPAYYAGVLPPSGVPMTSLAAGTFSLAGRRASSSSDFVFTNFNRKAKNTYPWKTGIITTEFWIGEGGSNISSTDNRASSWDESWVSSNHGTDSPYVRDPNGYASGSHASTVNPFYVALPFNDLAFPDKARDWLPAGWYRRPKDGKQVSACKDRWVWIKNAQGRSCFAQWEDVGPLRYDHAEYVFGSERPDTYTRAGLDVSPAVAQYLGIDENKRAITSWRFVDDEDVPPGQWLKYDEQAVIFTALEQLKNSRSSTELPIQKATEPIEDPDNIDSNKKKVDASKG
jgi:hypothetical protein